MINHLAIRTGLGLPMAGLIVWGLYGFMSAIIADEFVPPEPEEPRILSPFRMPTIPRDPPSPGPAAPELPDVEPPPATPKMTAQIIDVSLPASGFTGGTPPLQTDRLLEGFTIAPAMIADRYIQPLSPPAIMYPESLAIRGVEGNCDMRFDVDTAGKAFNVAADCTHNGFRREAERAMRQMLFAPAINGGVAQIQQNVRYAIEFRLTEE